MDTHIYMYIYLCICVCMYVIYIYAYAYVCVIFMFVLGKNTCMHSNMYLHSCRYISMCIYIDMCTYMYMCTYVYINISMLRDKSVYLCTSIFPFVGSRPLESLCFLKRVCPSRNCFSSTVRVYFFKSFAWVLRVHSSMNHASV